MDNIDITHQKKLALEILIYFADFCERNNLKYFLAYGTLIGAVRHKGYIPWDDDIDVMMPREDYEKLMVSFNDHPYYKPMNIDIDSNYGKLFGVINDTRTIKIEQLTRKRCQGTVGVNIDIFPIDRMPNTIIEQKEILLQVRKIENQMACLTYSFGKGRTIFSTIRKNVGIALMRTLDRLNVITPISLKKKHKKLLEDVRQDSNFAGTLTNTGFNGIKEIMPKFFFEDTVMMEFEGHMFRVPKEYDKMLTHIYGDYMTLPPIEKRISHHENECIWI